jgi:S1-C subfamily serine protease
MKRFLSLLWCACLAGPTSAAMDRAAFVALSASVLRIEAPRSNGGYALGSAVVVDKDLVVTNCHVTRDALEVFVVRGGARWTASAQSADVARDLCVLRVPGLRGQTVRLAPTTGLGIGQAVTAIGFTGGTGIQNSTGEVVALHRHDGSRVIQTNNWFSSGASGGGLFDDDARLIGILTFRLRGGEAHYFAAPADWLREMLDQPGRFPFLAVAPLPREGLPFWQQRWTEQPQFLRALECSLSAETPRPEPARASSSPC